MRFVNSDSEQDVHTLGKMEIVSQIIIPIATSLLQNPYRSYLNP